MNFSFAFWQHAWHVIGWTMIDFLALGTIVMLTSAVLRIALRNASPSLRYGVSLAGFAVLAILPLAIAGYLTASRVEGTDAQRWSTLIMSETTDITNTTIEAASRERERPELIRLATESTEDTEKIVDPAVALVSSGIELDFQQLLNQSVEYLPWLWLVGTPLTFLLLASGVIGAERLRASCQHLSEGLIRETCQRLQSSLNIGRDVGIAICDRIATPLLVGVVKPLILLPPAALNGWTTEELEMVLLHELAHVRRWDNAVNLGQRIVESLLFFHPAVWIVSNWVRRDREDCCDAVVVAYTAKPQAYAELLLALASHQPLVGLAATAMAQHPIALRIRRILKLEDEPMLVSRKAFVVAASTMLAIVVGVTFLGSSEADEVTTKNTNDTKEEASLPRGHRHEVMVGGEVSRAAERVEDERVLEETTNQTNDTNNDDVETIRRWFEAKNSNPLQRVEYEVHETSRNQVQNWFEGYQKDPYGPLVDFEWEWVEVGSRISIEAPQDAHEKLFHPFFKLMAKVAKPNRYETTRYSAILFDEEGRPLNSPSEDLAMLGRLNDASKEETTNQTNDTNKNLTTEDTESTENEQSLSIVYEVGDLGVDLMEWMKATYGVGAFTMGAVNDKSVVVTAPKSVHDKLGKLMKVRNQKPASSQFPTLEEQRAADLAYKLLGVELEKLAPEELERVKAKGYQGGLRVTGGKQQAGIGHGDLLVGLHIWPTASLKQVQGILARFDLHELSPLKFYVIRQRTDGGFGREGEMVDPAAAGSPPDQVITGRISVDLKAWAEKEGFKQERLKQTQPMSPSPTDPAPASPTEQPRFPGDSDKRATTLLYDGKTFDEWRDLWTTELKTEKRIDCIKAFAAFGRAGKGKEAAEAILEVAGEYDFGKFEGNSAQKLKEAISQVMGGIEGIEGQYWLPLLIERLESDPDKWSSFAEWRILNDVSGENVIGYLKEIATNSRLSAPARGAALAGLASLPDVTQDEVAVLMVREALSGDEPRLEILDRLRFNRLDLFPEQVELLLHDDDQIRNPAVGVLQQSPNPSNDALIAGALLKAIDEPARKTDHPAAIFALGKLRSFPRRNSGVDKGKMEVIDKLGRILVDGDSELLPATLVTMSALTARDEVLVIDALGDRITDERRKELEQAVDEAEKLKEQAIGGGGMF